MNRAGQTGEAKNIIHFSAVEDWHESILLKAAIPGLDNMFVAGVYRPPNNPLADLTHFITNTLEYTDNWRLVYAGDFNIGVLSNSNAMRNYVDTLHQYGLINEINLSTYVSPSTGIDTLLNDHL